MNTASDSPGKIQSFFRNADHIRWHRMQSKQHILRSQLGFTNPGTSTQPKACRGCANYHGIAYGYSKESRAVLVCGFHPYGWYEESSCPDWCGVG